MDGPTLETPPMDVTIVKTGRKWLTPSLLVITRRTCRRPLVTGKAQLGLRLRANAAAPTALLVLVLLFFRAVIMALMIGLPLLLEGKMPRLRSTVVAGIANGIRETRYKFSRHQSRVAATIVVLMPMTFL